MFEGDCGQNQTAESDQNIKVFEGLGEKALGELENILGKETLKACLSILFDYKEKNGVYPEYRVFENVFRKNQKKEVENKPDLDEIANKIGYYTFEPIYVILRTKMEIKDLLDNGGIYYISVIEEKQKLIDSIPLPEKTEGA